jgi:hypothetical protein
MKNKIRVYCDFSCLQEIYEQCHKPIADFKQEDKPLVWANLYSLLYEQSELFVNLTDSKFQDLKENPFFNKLFKDNKLYNFAEDFDKIDKKEDDFLLNIHPQTLFFLDKTPDECKILEEDFGMLFIAKTELVQKAAWLFQWAICNIEKNGKIYTNWNFLEEFKHPCNSLVLADNYVLNKENSHNEENLLEVIKALLPKKLNKQVFHLTIIADSKDIDSTLLEKHYKFLNEKLADRSIFGYKIELTILLTKAVSYDTRHVHDRNIITNYVWFNSGFGFTIFKNKQIIENTQIICLPFSYLHPNYKPYKDINATNNATNYESFSSVYDIIVSLRRQYQNINAKSENIDKPPIKLLSFQSSNNKQNRLLNPTL